MIYRNLSKGPKAMDPISRFFEGSGGRAEGYILRVIRLSLSTTASKQDYLVDSEANGHS